MARWRHMRRPMLHLFHAVERLVSPSVARRWLPGVRHLDAGHAPVGESVDGSGLANDAPT
jgi:hypothetical protein